MTFNDEVKAEYKRHQQQAQDNERRRADVSLAVAQAKRRLADWFASVRMTPQPVTWKVDLEDINTSDYRPSDYRERAQGEWTFEGCRYTAWYSSGYESFSVNVWVNGNNYRADTREDIGSALSYAERTL